MFVYDEVGAQFPYVRNSDDLYMVVFCDLTKSLYSRFNDFSMKKYFKLLIFMPGIVKE